MPLAAQTKKQSCVSHSTPEAEIVSMNMAVRTLGIPALHVWDTLLGRKVGLGVMEDNDATILIVKTGKNPTLRHISRTHGVNVAWLHEVFQQPEFRLYYQPTLGQCSDIFTKPFPTAAAWKHACDLIGILSNEVMGSGRGGATALQSWADRVRTALFPGLSKSGGEKKKATCPIRASHDTLTPLPPTGTTRTTAAVAAAVNDVKSSLGFYPSPALCAPALINPLTAFAFGRAMAFTGMGARGGVPDVAAPAAGLSSGKGKGAGAPVAETPRGDRARGSTDMDERGRARPLEHRGQARGRSASRGRRDRSYDPRGTSMSTNRSRSASAFRDKNTNDRLRERLCI